MKRLGHAIRVAVGSNVWFPFLMDRNGVPFLHLFFANDLIVYAKDTLDQAGFISSILSTFGPFSGHKVNVRKTRVCSSPNTGLDIRQLICTTQGYQAVLDLGTY
ncbi:hypothetical protein V6N13_135490 [Hibiscus sabdariffa]